MSTAAAIPPTTAGPSHHTRRFLRRLTVATGGGMFVDGFVFASVASALAGSAMARDIGVTSTWNSLISSSTLIGTFFGGLLLGYVTDRLGRRPMFTIDLSVFLASALLMLFVTSPWMVFALGLVMGLAVGADYSIGSPLLAEFAPSEKRGHYLGILEILWNVGYVVAYLLGYIINTTWPGAWHITLAASAVPAVFCLLIRHGLPESPRWLISKGRRDEAVAVIERDLGTTLDSEDFNSEETEQTRYRELFSAAYLRRTVFVCTFWICIVLPYFALTFFQPTVLRAIGLGGNALAGALIGTIVALTGAATGWWLVDRVGRRTILVWPMFGCALALFLVSLGHVLPVWLATVCFFGYLFSYGIMSILPGIYPDEVFPTSIRTSGVGLASAASRIGAAIGTFLLPVSLDHLGLSWSMIFMAAVSLIGGITALMWAPETNGLQLTATGHREADTGGWWSTKPVLVQDS
ncbi:sugar porter family MFS transporter [Streptomyces sp. NBC_01020]|uniref:MFS transporter n=1 Tax=unclassified Streptomyces TaxID=2593676 RepID=UPI0038707197|nr:sugar porter family MFS transporter [Streptomyces sp. NBC_01020]WSX65316.1 sugar porter family MFS transporter [Streptomyces sp. NBC_00932]